MVAQVVPAIAFITKDGEQMLYSSDEKALEFLFMTVCTEASEEYKDERARQRSLRKRQDGEDS